MAKTFLFWLLVTFFLMTAPSVDAQQPKKVPRIGYLAAPMQLRRPPALTDFDRLCASWVTSKDRPSPLSTAIPRERPNGS